MGRFKKGFMKRVIAILLSGTMVMSNMTAFASEAPADAGGYIEEVADETDRDDDTEREDADKKEAETVAVSESATEDAAAEETTKSEDNASNGKETDVETVEATDTEVSDEEQTSATEETTITETETEIIIDEDAKVGEVQSMEQGKTYTLNANEIDVAAVKKEEGYVAIIKDVFGIICGGSTVVDTGRGENFYYITDKLQAKKVPFTQRLALGGSPSKTKQSIKFTTAEAVDVTVYWMSKGTSAAPRQMSILGDDGKQKVATDEITIFNNSMYVSTMTLDDAGTYYLGGNNYIYNVIVEPKGSKTENSIPESIISNDGKNVIWDFSDKTVFPEMVENTAENLAKGAEGCLVKYCGLEVDGSKNNPDVLGTANATLGKIYVRNDNNVQINQNTVIRIPIKGRSKIWVTVWKADAECYSVDGTKAKSVLRDEFTCNGDNGYATFVMLKGGNYLQKIEVEKINEITVSGTVDIGGAIPEGLEVIFTDTKDKNSVIKDTIGNGGSYSVTLYEGSTYDISLSDSSYNISEPENKQIDVGSTTITDFVIKTSSLDVNEVSGTITFEKGAAPDNFGLKLDATEGTHSTRAVIENDTYKVSLEKGKTYTVSLLGTGMEDYEASPAELSADTANQPLTIKEKTKYNVNLKVNSFDNKLDFSESDITFTNVKENDDDTDTAKYQYTFKIGDDNVALRDGTYTMSVSKKVEYPYQLTYANLTVQGADKEYTLDFIERMTWDFTADGQKKDPILQTDKPNENAVGEQLYHGLLVNTNGTNSGKFGVGATNVQVNADTKVKIPVSGRGKVSILPANGKFMLKKLTSMDQDASGVADQNVNGQISYNEDMRYILMESTGNPLWLTKIEVTRDPAVEVSGKISGPADFDISQCTVSFINQTDDSTIPVAVEADGSYTVKLTSGHKYIATLSGNAQYGFADTNKEITVGDSNITNSDLTVVSKSTVKYSGNITGFAADYERLDNLKVILTAGVEKVELTINKADMSFEAVLESGTEYTVSLEGVDDYSLTSDATIKQTANYTADITVEPKPTYEVSGKFLELDGAEITKVSFTRLNEEGALDKNYVYPAVVNETGDGYSARLRDGEYEASAEVNGYTTKTHVIVDGGKVVRDLLFIWTDTSKLDYKSDLYVGYDDKEDGYNTVTKALKAAKRMSPSADKRITIHIAPGTYREQITVDVPYITFKNDTPSEEVKLTWYYGIGYQYYSIKPSLGENGFYDAEYAYNKTEKHTAFRWGCTVLVKATDFRAENIIFENSFNRYLTKEELADGVEPIEQKDKKPVRNSSLDLRSKKAGERAAALYIEDQGDRAEFYNCQFLSNQDTVGTGSKTPRSYFKDCLIEGNTDYICGAGDAVFDNCELKFAGYSDASSGGYITAASLPRQYGYLFWNCKVTGTTNEGANKDVGYLGRPWFSVQYDENGKPVEGQKRATVTFVNTVLDRADIIVPAGWNEMKPTKPEDAVYKEYNTTVKGGGAADTSNRTAGTVVTENPVTDMTVYFGGWTPAYYNHVDAPVADIEPGKVPKGTKVALECATEGAVIHYTTNGDKPTAQSAIYESGKPISLDTEGEVVIKAIAIKGNAESEEVEFAYTVVDAEKFVSAPVASVKSGKVSKGTKVALECATEGAEIRYTTNGENPTAKSTLYKEAIVITETMTIKAIALKGDALSEVAAFTYTVEPEIIDPETVEKPTSDRPDGVVPVGKTVTLHCEEGAKIYYTMDGTVPTGKESELYDGKPIALGNEAKTIVIKAIAVKGDAKSEVATFTYTVSVDIDPDKFVSAPVSDVEQGEVKKGTKVTLTTATPEAKIYYTMDETEPTAQSTEYTGPIDLGNEAKKVVIKAIAIKGENKSSIATFAYTVTNQQVTPEEPDPVEPDDPGIDKENIWITGLKETYAYTGAKIIPDIKVWDCDITGADRLLAPGIDYTVAYKNNAKPGKADVIVTGKGNYVGKGVTASFNIEEAKGVEAPDSVKGAKIDKIKDVITYTGKAKHPDFKLTLKGSKTAVTYTFDEETQVYVRADGQPMNVNVAISNNVNKGTATILVSGAKEKNKTTSVKATFKILPADLSKATVKVEATAGVYAVKGAVPGSLTVTCDGKRLINGIDYTVKYGNNKKAGAQGTITVTGKGNYTKKAPAATFDINQLDMSKISVEAVTACEKMAAGKVKATVVDGDGNALKASQYTLKIYKEAEGDAAYGAKDVLSAGATIYVEAVAKDTVNLSEKTLRAEFKVGKDISKAKVVLSDKIKKGIAYTGGRITLKEGDLTVTLRGVTGSLKMGDDYELVAYSNNINKGTATAVIRGKGDYSGTKTIKFKITQKTMIKGN
ncbi:hypothetical protein C809_01372 [Lachnospiraceae bacterium MD335]|nr:hypothetical protein C809_01372 [Lachnospiraceae bacterium MD335]